MGLEVLDGRDFDESRSNDSINFIVNEACIRLFAEQDSMWSIDPFGQVLNWKFMSQKGKVIGIVKDFHFESLRNEIKPLIITEHLPFTSFIGLKITGGDLKGAVARIEGLWEDMFPTIPFQYSFANDTFNQTFQAELRLGKLFIIFASLSIFIAMLGLLGLAASVAHEKTKEIGIRKVIGASQFDIIYMLLSRFLWVVLIANLIAIPTSYLFSNKWLDEFSYRIDWPIGAAFISLSITLLISLGTIFFHALKSSSINPSEALANE